MQCTQYFKYTNVFFSGSNQKNTLCRQYFNKYIFKQIQINRVRNVRHRTFHGADKFTDGLR